jgi:hypothetical protein
LIKIRKFNFISPRTGRVLKTILTSGRSAIRSIIPIVNVAATVLRGMQITHAGQQNNGCRLHWHPHHRGCPAFLTVCFCLTLAPKGA